MPWVICSGAERCPSPGVGLRTHVGYSTHGRAEGVAGCLGDGGPRSASTGSPGSDTSAGLRHNTTIQGEGFSMGIFRLYTGDDGESHMEELDLASHPELTALQGATSAVFRSTPPGTFSDWHTAPRRQYVIILSRAAEIGLRDGTTHRLGPGDVNMTEDLTEHGYTTRVIG